MAIQTPSNLYSGAAQVVNSQPSINFMAQLMAHKQAKKDALDQYYSKLSDNAGTEEGKMRPRDVETGWGKKLNDYQMFYMNPENKKAILNPSKYGYEKLNTWNAMHNDLIKDARDSKYYADQDKLIDQYNQSGKWNPTNKDWGEVANIHKSIYDKSREITENDPLSGLPITRKPSIDYLSLNIPSFDGQKQIQFDKAVIGDIKPSYDESKARFDKNTGEVFLPKAYTPDKIKIIADNAANAITTNPSARVRYEHLSEDPEFIKIATPAFQAIYGKVDANGNENNIDSPQKAAAADYATKMMQAGGEEKVTDWQLKQKLQNQFATDKMYAQHKLTQDNIRLAAGLRDVSKHQGEVEGADTVLRDVAEIINKGEKYDKVNEVGRIFTGAQPSISEISDPNLLKTFSGIRKIGTTPVPPDRVSFDKDKDQFNLVYNDVQTKDEKGNNVKIDGATIPISARDYVKLKVKETYPNKDIGFINNIVDKVIDKNGGLYNTVQLYNPDNKAQVTPKSTQAAQSKVKEPVYNVKGKKMSHSELKKMGYTDDDINNAIKLGNISK